MSEQKLDSYKLNNKWNLYIHCIKDRNWDNSSYKKIYSFNNLKELFSITNNLEYIGLQYYHFFIMKEGIFPTWEDLQNRDGGVCSFRTDLYPTSSSSIYVVDLFKFLIYKTLGETVINDMDDINGLSVSPRNNWAIIKIWNKDKNKSELLKKELKQTVNEKFGNVSIKYKSNVPEY